MLCQRVSWKCTLNRSEFQQPGANFLMQADWPFCSSWQLSIIIKHRFSTHQQPEHLGWKYLLSLLNHSNEFRKPGDLPKRSPFRWCSAGDAGSTTSTVSLTQADLQKPPDLSFGATFSCYFHVICASLVSCLQAALIFPSPATLWSSRMRHAESSAAWQAPGLAPEKKKFWIIFSAGTSVQSVIRNWWLFRSSNQSFLIARAFLPNKYMAPVAICHWVISKRADCSQWALHQPPVNLQACSK